jgi:hypothetical protein
MPWSIDTFTPGVLHVNKLRQLSENFSVLSQHNHTGVAGDGARELHVEGYNYDATILPRFPASNTGFTFVVSSSVFYNTYASSSNQNDEIAYPVGLFAGTYRFTLLYHSASDQGIATVSLDGVSVGTIDTYASSGSNNVQASIDGIVVASNAWLNFKMKMSTKNGSSSGYKCRWSAATFRRIGA